MTIELRISLGPSGLTVHLPRGRTINVGATEAGARFIQKMLQDAEAYEERVGPQRGYIGAYPTQQIAELWQRQARNNEALEAEIAEVKARKAREAEEAFQAKWKARGIDPSAIKIEL